MTLELEAWGHPFPTREMMETEASAGLELFVVSKFRKGVWPTPRFAPLMI
jgi:hypothetical protein